MAQRHKSQTVPKHKNKAASGVAAKQVRPRNEFGTVGQKALDSRLALGLGFNYRYPSTHSLDYHRPAALLIP